MKKKNLNKLIPIILWGMILTVFGSMLWAQDLKIHYINVQQGQSILIIGPNGTTILCDGGDGGKGTSRVIPYLEGMGITRTEPLDYIILTHRDDDHYKGLTEVMEYGYDALNVFDNGSDKYSTSIQDFLDAAAGTTAGGVSAISLGRVIDLGNGAVATCVAANGSVIGVGPIPSGQNNENDRSVCLLIQYGDFDFLVTGDAGGGDADNSCTGRSTTQIDIETPLVQAIKPGGAHPLLSSDGVEIAHVGHHGSESSGNSNYMNYLTPTVACISVGDGQSTSFQHPRIDVVENVLLKEAYCITAPAAALVLQTEEGNPAGSSTSFAGYCVGDITITTNGVHSYTISATGNVSQGPNETTSAGLPFTHYFDGYPKMTITSPNGGEKWYQNSTKNITWTSAGGSENVKITLWKNAVKIGAIISSTPNTGSYSWKVGNYEGGSVLPGTGYTVNVKEIGASVSDESDASFEILAAPTLTVTAPNGGESWCQGSIKNITWASSGVSGNLKITLWKSGVKVGTIASSTPNTGSYLWTVGNYEGGVASPGTGYTIFIKELSTNVSDGSNASFAITSAAPKITVTAPNGGENWNKGSVENITWTSSGVPGNVKITLWKNGLKQGTIASSAANTGSYSWTVGNYEGGSVSPGTGYTINIKEIGTSVADSSNSTFNIL